MNRQIEWIKQIVELCMKNLSKGEKRKGFEELEKEYQSFTDAEQKNIRNILITQFEVNDAIYVLSCIIEYFKVKAFQEDLLHCILEGNFDCYLGSMLEFQIMGKVEGNYAWKRILHKRNLVEFDKLLDINYTYVPVEKRNKNRIVIVTDQLLNDLHAPTKVVLNYAYVLQECLGYEVLMFVCPCDGMKVIPEELWYRPMIMNADNNLISVPMRRKYRDAIFSGYQINMTYWSLKEYHMMLSLIHAWNPLFVFDMGTTNSVIDLAGKFTTLAAMEMSIECPISEGKILVRLDKKDDESEKEFAETIGDNQIQLFMDESMPVITEKSQHCYSRAETGLPEDKFLIAVVGNRLDGEIDAEFASVMENMLKQVSDIAFVMIGEVEEAKSFFDKEIFEDHLYYLGYREDLVGTYDMLDLYVNPKRAGGGFSSVMALLAGIPVVTLPGGDVAYNVGEDFTVQSYEEMIEFVCKCVTDRQLYEEKKKCAQDYAERNTDDKMMQYVKKMLDGIIEIMEEQER